MTLSVQKIFVALNLVIALLAGVYGYIYLNKSVNKEANRVLSVYKQQGFDSLKDEMLTLSRQPKGYQPTLNDFRQTCNFYQNVQRPLTEVEISVQQIKTLQGTLLNEADKISRACHANNDLANVIMRSMANQKSAIHELGRLKQTKYSLKGTWVDRLPIHGLLILAIIALIAYLRNQKPHNWLKLSLHETIVLFVIALFLGNTLNSLYILLIFPCIIYLGYLMILQNRQTPHH